MSTDTYRASILRVAGRALTLRYEPLDDHRRLSTSRTFWLGVLAEGIAQHDVESPIADEIDPHALFEDVDARTDEARAQRFVASVRAPGAIAASGVSYVRREDAAPVEVGIELTESRWAEGLAEGLSWSGLVWDGALDAGDAAAPQAPPFPEHALEDRPTLWRDRALAVEAALVGRDPASLSPAHARAWLLATWLRRPGRANELSLHGLPYVLHDVGPSGIAPALGALRALASDAPELALSVLAAEAFVGVLDAASPDARQAFFDAPMGTHSELAERAFRACEERFGASWTVHPFEPVVERELGAASASVREIVGHDVRPTYWTSMQLESRIEQAPGPWVRETGLRGRTPLHELVSWEGHAGTLGLVRAAVAAGADPNARDHAGMTPLLVLLETAGPDALEHPEKLYPLTDAVRTFVELGADVHARATDGRSVVGLAVARAAHDGALLDLLAELGARFDVAAFDGQTPLFVAGTAGAVTALLARGARIEQRSLSGHTPIVEAISGGRAGAAIALLEAGADTDRPGKWGGTLLAATLSAWDMALALKKKTTDFPRLVSALVTRGQVLDGAVSAKAVYHRAKIEKALAKVKLQLPPPGA